MPKVILTTEAIEVNIEKHKVVSDVIIVRRSAEATS